MAASDAKLEGLRKMAADERTPVEEARNAALAFVRAGGGLRGGAEPAEVAALRRQVSQLEAEVAAFRESAQSRLEQLRAERDRAVLAGRERDEAREALAKVGAALATIFAAAGPWAAAEKPEQGRARVPHVRLDVEQNPFWSEVFSTSPFGKKP